MGRKPKVVIPKYVITSPQEIKESINVLARARLHLSEGRYAITAMLIQETENKLKAFGKEDSHGQEK